MGYSINCHPWATRCGKNDIDVAVHQTARETFVVNQLGYMNEVEYGKKTGDFKINGRYILEVGGEGKTYDQIADVPDSFILADGIETPYRSKLPLWIVGFLY